MKILVIGAHFDDAEIGCGGALIRQINQNNEVHIAVLHFNETRTGPPATRLKEQAESLRRMGTPQPFLSYFLEEDRAAHIISELDKIEADLIYVPWERDTHQAHVWASAIGLSLTRKGADYLYYNSGSAVGFVPNYWVHINWLRKKKLLDCFNSQIGHMRFVESSVEGFIVGRLTVK